MQMSKPAPVPIVKGNSLGNLSVSGTNVKRNSPICFNCWKLYKRASKELILTQFCVSGLFWQKFNPDIDHWNEIENIGLMLRKKLSVLSKVVSTKVELVKYIAKSTIVANFQTWSFCVENLKNKTININVMQRHGIA